jgi:hypothetical protein
MTIGGHVQLDEAAAIGLAGPDVHDVDTALTVEPVTADDVAAAEKAHAEAEARATRSEHQALTGAGTPVQAASDREAARYAGLRAPVTRRRHQRALQADRIKGLADAGAKAASHAAALNELRTAVLADVAEIGAAASRARQRCREWNTRLGELISEAEALSPEKPRPGNVPSPASAGVYASAANPTFITGATILKPINIEDAKEVHELVPAVDAAVTTGRQHDPSERLIIHPSGLVQPFPADPYGHTARRIEAGQVRELSLAERLSYFKGEAVAF